MHEFFSSDGKLFQVMNKIGQMALVNIVFLIGCLPIITIGTSVTAFYYTMIKSIRRERGYPVREFVKAYKRNLKNGILMTIFIGAWIALLLFNRKYAILVQNNLSITLIVIYDCLLVITLLWSVCLFPVMSRFSLSIKKLMQLSLFLMMKHVLHTFLLAALIGGSLITAFFTLPIPLILILPAALCYISTYLAEPMLLCVMPENKQDEDVWYYESSKGDR